MIPVHASHSVHIETHSAINKAFCRICPKKERKACFIQVSSKAIRWQVFNISVEILKRRPLFTRDFVSYVSELYLDAFHVLQTLFLEHSFNPIFICQIKIVLKFVDSIINNNKAKYSQLLYAQYYRCVNFSNFHAKKAYIPDNKQKIIPAPLHNRENLPIFHQYLPNKFHSTHVKSE